MARIVSASSSSEAPRRSGARRSWPSRGEEAGVELALGREPRARAAAAERLGHRGDHADLAGAVAVAEAARRLVARGRRAPARAARRSSMRRTISVGRDDVVEAPAVRGADVHVLDEAERVPGAAEALGEPDDVSVVDAALDDRVHLDRQAGGGGRVDPLEHAGDREVDVVQRREDLVVERVEADRDAVEPGAGERLRLLRAAATRSSSGRARDPGSSCRSSTRCSTLRRTSGSPPVIRTVRTPSPAKTRGDAGDLLEREQLLAVEERVVAAEDLLRHAVDAAEVAAVGDRDAQRLERPAERVAQRLHAQRTGRGATRPQTV